MNLPTALVLSSFALGVGGVASYLALTTDRTVSASDPDADSISAEDLARIQSSITELQASVEELRRDDEVVLAAPRQAAGISDESIERAIAAYLESHGGVAALGEAAPTSVEKVALGTPAELAALLADANEADSAALWRRIVEEGLDDELLAFMAAEAEANPNDPEVQLALGEAYIGRTQEAGAGPLAGKYATLADQAFDAALEADPNHWKARFTKAASLSFWPPILGKQPEAIREFETLISQQAGAKPEPHHAQTHLLLGTLYQQTGQNAKALETWQAGLGLFPGNESLAQQIALAGGQ